MLSFSLDADKTDSSMRQHSLLLWIVLVVGGVFCVEVPVSVMEGDSVTLISNVTEIQKNEELKWTIRNGEIIAKIDRETNIFSVAGNQSFKGRLKLNETTGSLTITNISSNDTRDYKLQIDAKTEREPRIFKVTVNGVFSVDGVKPVSAKEGQSVVLPTFITNIPEDDVIEWTFGPQNTSIIKTDRTNGIILQNKEEEIFKNRLVLDKKSGDLTINNLIIEASGLYQIKIIKSAHTIQKRFNVNVSNSGVSPGAVAGIVVGLLVFHWCLQL